MLIRALVVFLAVLNLGVAAWWLTRTDPVTVPAPAQAKGVPSLRLLAEAPSAAGLPAPVPASAPDPAPAGPAPASPGAAVPPARSCYALGPFADAGAASAAAARAGALTVRTREEAAEARAYDVFLPPEADRAAAQAVAQRLGAAGFDDFLVIGSGALANGIALGRYRSRDGAQDRQAKLQAAGFAARLQPVGPAGATKWWADVAVAAPIDGARAIQCAALR